MKTENTMPELYDESEMGGENAMSQQEILMNEQDILAGLLELGKAKDESSNYRKIEIRRGGVLKLEFRIRPITEDEQQACLRNGTKYKRTKPGQPKIPIETEFAKYRSHLIYTATVDEDRAKVWDNRKAQEALNILQGVDMVDRVLLLGEKERVIDNINEISGFSETDEDIVEIAKN